MGRMMAATLKTLLLVTAILLCAAIPAGAETFALRFNKCVDLLKPWFDVHIGAETVSTYDTVGNEIQSLRKEMEAMDASGVVVYLPFQVFRRSEAGEPQEFKRMVTLRFETQGASEPLIEDLLFPQQSVQEDQFETLLKAAQKPSATEAHEELLRFLPIDHGRDDGKKVFVKDINLYGVMPQSLGIRDAVAISSSSVGAALEHRASLATLKPSPKDFTAIVGYPEEAQDLNGVFDGQNAAPLTTWRQRSEEFSSMARRHQIDLVAAKELRSLNGKKELLARLENAKGIVMVVAHTDGATIRLPGVEPLVITPADILGLRLKHAPFVILRICNGVDLGYSDAFSRAGASGVWANRGVISAASANRQVAAFFDELGKGHSVEESIRKVQTRDAEANVAAALFTQAARGDSNGRGKTG